MPFATSGQPIGLPGTVCVAQTQLRGSIPPSIDLSLDAFIDHGVR